MVQEHWPPVKKRQRGRPPAGGPKDPAFFCPVEGCNKAYGSYGGLYLHKRSHHPELIPKSEEEERERKRSKRDKAPPAKAETAYQFFCKEARAGIKEAGAAG